jgi:hypothetical protein
LKNTSNVLAHLEDLEAWKILKLGRFWKLGDRDVRPDRC